MGINLENRTRNKSWIIKPAVIFLIAKAFTWISLLISTLVICGGDNFMHNFKHALVNWDAIWFLKIAAEGYDLPRKCVFFPLMPLCLKFMSLFIRDYAWAGVLLSNIFCFAGSLLFYKLVEENYGKRNASTALVLMLTSPTALFYTNLYSESLFFMLSVMVFYFARHKRFLAAAVAAGLASATRNYGVMLVAPLLWEFFMDKKINKDVLIKAAGFALAASSGLIIYSVYLYVSRNDAFYFINAQNLWHGRNHPAFPFTALFTRLPDISGLFRIETDPMKTNLSLLYFCAAIALNIYGFKKVKGSEFVYFTLFTLFLSFQPMLMSLSRYISGIFVFWLIAALFISNRRSPWLWAAGSAAVLLIWQSVINFRWIAGMWVA